MVPQTGSSHRVSRCLGWGVIITLLKKKKKKRQGPLGTWLRLSPLREITFQSSTEDQGKRPAGFWVWEPAAEPSTLEKPGKTASLALQGQARSERPVEGRTTARVRLWEACHRRAAHPGCFIWFDWCFMSRLCSFPQVKTNKIKIRGKVGRRTLF